MRKLLDMLARAGCLLVLAGVVAIHGIVGCRSIQQEISEAWEDIEDVWPPAPDEGPVTTTTTTTTTTTAEPNPDEAADEGGHLGNPEPLHSQVCSVAGATEIPCRDGGGRFVWNPANSRRKGKAIFPGKYAGLIVKGGVYWFRPDGSGCSTMYRALPDESGQRQRYYTEEGISALPETIVVRADLADGKDIVVVIPNTQERWD